MHSFALLEWRFVACSQMLYFNLSFSELCFPVRSFSLSDLSIHDLKSVD
jgi:hypothetical protein